MICVIKRPILFYILYWPSPNFSPYSSMNHDDNHDLDKPKRDLSSVKQSKLGVSSQETLSKSQLGLDLQGKRNPKGKTVNVDSGDAKESLSHTCHNGGHHDMQKHHNHNHNHNHHDHDHDHDHTEHSHDNATSHNHHNHNHDHNHTHHKKHTQQHTHSSSTTSTPSNPKEVDLDKEDLLLTAASQAASSRPLQPTIDSSDHVYNVSAYRESLRATSEGSEGIKDLMNPTTEQDGETDLQLQGVRDEKRGSSTLLNRNQPKDEGENVGKGDLPLSTKPRRRSLVENIVKGTST